LRFVYCPISEIIKSGDPDDYCKSFIFAHLSYAVIHDVNFVYLKEDFVFSVIKHLLLLTKIMLDFVEKKNSRTPIILFVCKSYK
jgi:hypothetical protein